MLFFQAILTAPISTKVYWDVILNNIKNKTNKPTYI